jgi:ribosomal-protein-alanine N-acetyltransferase
MADPSAASPPERLDRFVARAGVGRFAGTRARACWVRGMAHVSIELPRFLLRDSEETDRGTFVSHQRDPRGVALYSLDPGDARRAENLFDPFRKWRRERPRSDFQLGMFDRRTAGLCGRAGLRGADGDEAVLGIKLAPNGWGRFGPALDATAALLGFGFERLRLCRVVGSTASGNRRVEKLARRFGARPIAQREGPEWTRARGWREVDWALNREEWERARPSGTSTMRFG